MDANEPYDVYDVHNVESMEESSRFPLAKTSGIKRALVKRVRMATRGTEYAFDVYVKFEDAPDVAQRNITHVTILSQFHISQKWLRYEDATCSAEHFAMPLGFPRYDDWKRHELEARAESLQIALIAFPELVHANCLTLPELWVTLPVDVEHGTRWVDLATGEWNDV